MIIVFIIGLGVYMNCTSQRRIIQHHYQLTWNSSDYSRMPILHGNNHQRRVQSHGAHIYHVEQQHQSIIGCGTILGMMMSWSFGSLIISDFFRPLIPFGFYYFVTKRRIHRALHI